MSTCLYSIGITAPFGKMGQELIKRIQNMSHLKFSSGFVRKTASLTQENKKASLYTTDLIEFVKASSVIIDFSSWDLLEKLLPVAVEFRKPLVIGTTGLSDTHLNLLSEVSKKIAILYSANFSLGITLLQEIVNFLSKNLPSSWDIDLIETHHKHKKDKPSGTAKMLASFFNKKMEVVSLRSGQCLGLHHLIFRSPLELIEIKHEALDRSVFAEGAIQAAQFIIDKQPGFYSMKDIFNA